MATGSKPLVSPNLFEAAMAAKPRTYQNRKNATLHKIEVAMAEGDLQTVLDSLTGKQRAFVEEYLKDLNGAEAVLRAGYDVKPGNQNRMANQLLQNKAIRYAIDGLRAQRADHTPITADYVLRKIVDVIERSENGPKYDAQSILRATELLGRHLGLYKDKQEVSGPGGGPIETRDVQDNADEFLNIVDRLAERAKKT
jgi:phage terminase small subunit